MKIAIEGGQSRACPESAEREQFTGKSRKIFMVTRGSQGDVYPYLAVAKELTARGHRVTLSLPPVFENHAKELNLSYIPQSNDDVVGLLDGAAQTSQSSKYLLKWMRRIIDTQFEDFIPVLMEHDIFVASNTEFASVSIAEYCKKTIIRTAFAPLLPGKKIPPPIMPLSNTNKVFTPAVMWKLLNKATNFMVKKTVNKNREKLGMRPIEESYGYHAAGNAHNYLMHSQYLGNTDPCWIFKWNIGGYCFNNSFKYEQEAHDELTRFVEKDNKPLLFFTLGSCNAKKKNSFCEKLLKVCVDSGYRLIVGSGWSKTGSHLDTNDNLFILSKPIPHNLIFPKCDAVIHHGGSGTTHSVALAGKPQMIVPLLLDQGYWASRVRELGAGPGGIKIAISGKQLKNKLNDLINNPAYKQNASSLANQLSTENGVANMCNYIESFA